MLNERPAGRVPERMRKVGILPSKIGKIEAVSFRARMKKEEEYERMGLSRMAMEMVVLNEPATFFTIITILPAGKELTGFVGIPDITPVSSFKRSPAGRTPSTTENNTSTPVNEGVISKGEWVG